MRKKPGSGSALRKKCLFDGLSRCGAAPAPVTPCQTGFLPGQNIIPAETPRDKLARKRKKLTSYFNTYLKISYRHLPTTSSCVRSFKVWGGHTSLFYNGFLTLFIVKISSWALFFIIDGASGSKLAIFLFFPLVGTVCCRVKQLSALLIMQILKVENISRRQNGVENIYFFLQLVLGTFTYKNKFRFFVFLISSYR